MHRDEFRERAHGVQSHERVRFRVEAEVVLDEEREVGQREAVEPEIGAKLRLLGDGVARDLEVRLQHRQEPLIRVVLRHGGDVLLIEAIGVKTPQNPTCKENPLRALFILGFLSFFVNLGYGIVLPVLPTLAAATALDVGFMYSSFSGTKLVAQLFGGAASDRFGAGSMVRLGVVLYALSLAGLAVSHTVPMVIVFRVVEGIAVGVCVPAMSAVVLGSGDETSFTKRHGIVLGIGGAGMVMGPLVGLLVGRDRVREAMLVIAIATVLAVFVLPPVSAERAKVDETAFSPRALLRYAASPAFIVLVLPLAFGKLAFGVMQPLLPIHAANARMSDGLVAALFALTGILFAATQPLVGALRRAFTPRSIAAFCVVASAGSLASIALFPGRVGFSAGYLAYVAFGSMLFAANSGLVGETHHEAESDHGKIFGAMHAVTDAGMLLGPPAVLALYERDRALSFVALGALGALAALVFWSSTTKLVSRELSARA